MTEILIDGITLQWSLYRVYNMKVYIYKDGVKMSIKMGLNIPKPFKIIGPNFEILIGHKKHFCIRHIGILNRPIKPKGKNKEVLLYVFGLNKEYLYHVESDTLFASNLEATKFVEKLLESRRV